MLEGTMFNVFFLASLPADGKEASAIYGKQ